MPPDQMLAPEPLAAIDAAMSGPGDDPSANIGDPFDAPSPLTGLQAPVADAAPLALMADGTTTDLPMPAVQPDVAAQLPADTGAPQARVLMSPGAHQPNAAFFTQLMTQTRF